MFLWCLFRYLTYKVVDDFHFLLFLSIHFLHFADYNPADQTVQHGFVQFLNGSILADFMDKGLYIAFLGFCTAYQQRQVLQAFSWSTFLWFRLSFSKIDSLACSLTCCFPAFLISGCMSFC